MAEPILGIRGLSKSYRKGPVLEGLDLEIAVGESVALVGTNGAGKSTFLGCVTANRLPDRGEIRVCGTDPFEDPAGAAACTGFVPEKPFLYDELTVEEMILFTSAARGADGVRAEADRLVELFGLEGARDTYCRDLSQGMARKTALIVGLAHDPRLVLLDEATNGLDRPSTLTLLDELDLRRQSGAAVFMSSHDLDLLAERCDWGILLAEGGRFDLLRGERWEAWRKVPTLRPTDARRDHPA